MTTLDRIKLRCPICKTKVVSNAIRSCGFVSKRSDFRPNYWGANPAFYMYHVCENCGFTATESNFKIRVDPALATKLRALGKPIADKLSSRMEHGCLCYEMLVDSGKVPGNLFSKANAWLQAFWWYDSGDERPGKIAIDYFRKALTSGVVPPEETSVVTYIMGEVSRRIGDVISASRYFDDAIALAEKDSEKKWLVDLARRQKENPQDNI